MMLRRRPARRSGSILIESAVVYPVLFLVVYGIMLVGLAVFRYQQAAHMAREGVRYAAVRGAKYAQENTRPAAVEADVFENGVKPHAAGMRASDITCAVAWDKDNKQTSSRVVTTGGVSTIKTVANTVSVTVTYSWDTGLFGVIPVSSTAVMTMSY